MCPCVTVDILGPLPETERGKSKYILVFGDYFTRWMEAFPMPNMEAETVARTLFAEIFSRFGCPRILHSDQGRQFESALFKALCEICNIDKTRARFFCLFSGRQHA